MGFFSKNLQMKNAKTRIQSVGVILATYKNEDMPFLVGHMSAGSGQMAGLPTKITFWLFLAVVFNGKTGF
jgi:hypothetical protein